MTQQTAEIRGGLLRAFASGTYLATVQISESTQNSIENVPVSRAIAAAELTPGRKVAIVFMDPSNQTDAVIFAVYT